MFLSEKRQTEFLRNQNHIILPMGVNISSHNNANTLKGNLTPEDVARFVAETNFKDREIVALAAKYKELAGSVDIGGDGLIDENDFISKMHISNRKIGSLMYHMLDTDGSGSIDFEEFLYGLNTFLPQSPLDPKIDLCFRAYDSDGNNTISKEEVRSIIEISLDGNSFITLTPESLNQLVDDLFKEYDEGSNEDLTKEQFANMIRHSPGILDCFEFDVATILN